MSAGEADWPTCDFENWVRYTPALWLAAATGGPAGLNQTSAEDAPMALTIAPGSTKIGWIGTGVMGSSMCGHLIDAGFSATVYTRSKEKAAALIKKGATWADSPKAVAEQSDVVFGIVGFPSDVRAVFLGDDGALAGSKEGNILVDMTTSDPSLAVEIYEAGKAKGVASVDAPVSGGDVGAKEARLSIMIGGDADVVEALNPLLERDGKNDRPSGWSRGRAAHENGQPDADCDEHDRCLRGAALRQQSGA